MEKLKNDVLNLLKENGSITNDEIAKILNADRKKVAYVILFFKRRGCINCYKVDKKRRIDVLKDDFTLVKNYATVSGNSIICGNSIVCDNAKIKDYAIVSGNSTVYNHVVVRSHAKINNHAKIKDENQWFVVENVGSRNDNITFYETDNVIYANVGCFSGTLDEFIKQVKITHKGNKFEKEYLQMAELAKVKLGGLNE